MLNLIRRFDQFVSKLFDKYKPTMILVIDLAACILLTACIVGAIKTLAFFFGA